MVVVVVAALVVVRSVSVSDLCFVIFRVGCLSLSLLLSLAAAVAVLVLRVLVVKMALSKSCLDPESLCH